MNSRVTTFHPFNPMEGQTLLSRINLEGVLSCLKTYTPSFFSFIVDFNRHKYVLLPSICLLVSDHLDFYDAKIPLYDSTLSEEHDRIIDQVQRFCSVISNDIPVTDMSGMVFFNDFHIRIMDTDVLVTQKFISLATDRNKDAEVGLFVVIPSRFPLIGKSALRQDNRLWIYNDRTNVLTKTDIPSITNKDRMMMLLSRSGLPVKEVAQSLNLTENTIKKQRNRLFRKLGAASLAEANIIMDNLNLW